MQVIINVLNVAISLTSTNISNVSIDDPNYIKTPRLETTIGLSIYALY